MPSLLSTVLLSVAVCLVLSALLATGVLASEYNLLGKFSSLILGLRKFTISTEIPSGVRVVEDISLTSGEYKALSSTPVSYKSKKDQAESGFIVEIGDESTSSKFILFYKHTMDFIDEFNNMNNIDEGDELFSSLTSIKGRDEVECWMCGEDSSLLCSQSGDEIKNWKGSLGYCTSSAFGNNVYLCSSCCTKVHREVISGDSSVIEPSDLVIKEI